jgi:hypothetical protein
MVFKKFTVTFTLALTLTLNSSCRLGTQTEKAAPPPAPLTGYYLASPQSLKLSVTTTDNALTHDNVPTDSIPSELAKTFSNPVIFKLQNATTGEAFIASNEGKAALPINIDSKLNLSFKGATSPQTYWIDPECLTSLQIIETGKLIQNAALPSPNGFPYPVSGRIDLKVQVTHFFDGDCTATFQTVVNCYLDPLQCGGQTAQENLTLQAYLESTFAPFIENNLITSGDIPKIVNYGYEVIYN